VLAIEFTLSQLGHCGVRLIQRVYELSQLDRLVACSVGVLSQRIKQMEERLANLPVTIIQVTSDEAKALIKSAGKHF
jgi:hypothetical protein